MHARVRGSGRSPDDTLQHWPGLSLEYSVRKYDLSSLCELVDRLMKGGQLSLSCAPVDGVTLLFDVYISRPATVYTLQ